MSDNNNYGWPQAGQDNQPDQNPNQDPWNNQSWGGTPEPTPTEQESNPESVPLEQETRAELIAQLKEVYRAKSAEQSEHPHSDRKPKQKQPKIPQPRKKSGGALFGCLVFSLPFLFTAVILVLTVLPGWGAIQRFFWPIPVGTVGSPVSYNDYTVLVNQVERADTYTDPNNNQARHAPASGEQFVFVDITYTSGNNDADISQIMFFDEPRLTDNQGLIYEADNSTGALRKPALVDNSGRLTKGSKVRGWVTFEVPKTAQGLLLSFAVSNSFVDGADSTTVRFQFKLDDQASATPAALPQASGKSGIVGQVLGDGPALMVVNSVVITGQVQTATGTITKADAGKKFVALNVTMTSQSDDGAYVNATNSSLKDSDNYSYKSSTCPYQPALGSITEVPKGFKVQGWVCFQVPTAASGLRFEYHSTVGGDVNLQVNLGN